MFVLKDDDDTSRDLLVHTTQAANTEESDGINIYIDENISVSMYV
jgi:hypothetical protein